MVAQGSRSLISHSVLVMRALTYLTLHQHPIIKSPAGLNVDMQMLEGRPNSAGHFAEEVWTWRSRIMVENAVCP